MNRALSVIDVKSVNEETRVIEGIATTPEVDRMGDVVESSGAVFKLPLPLLWQHNSTEPVGVVEFAEVTKKGIGFTARIARIDENGALRSLVDKAWQCVKAGLVRGVSIGFRELDSAPRKGDIGGIRFKKWEWLELSLVTVPANANATIDVIRSIDRELRAASGNAHSDGGREIKPGASGKSNHSNTRKRRNLVMAKPDEKLTIPEQIRALESTRAANAAQMEKLMVLDGGEMPDDAAKEEYDELSAQIDEIDEHLVRLRRLEKLVVEKATPVEDVTDTQSARESRQGVRVRVRGPDLPKGTAFTRYAIALAKSRGDVVTAAEVAKASWGDSTPEVESVLRAAVVAGTTTDPAWAAPLVDYQTMASEFIELLRPATIIGRIEGFRRVPFNVNLPGQISGSSVGWVGEGKPKPVSKLGFDTTKLGHTKAAGIVALTDELVRLSNPSAEALVRQDLINTMAEFLDHDFVNPVKAEVANVSPASVTNGVAPVVASGASAAALKADVKKLFGGFLKANLSVSRDCVWIMTSTQALSIAMMENALGQAEFAGITVDGGSFLGLPVIVSENIPAVKGKTPIILLKASEILLADDGQVMLDASREASLQMDTAPQSGQRQLMSLWQNNMIAVRAERWINWKRRRAAAVGIITEAAYA